MPKGGDATITAYTEHKAKGSFLDLYSARKVTEADFRDPMLQKAAEAPESDWFVTRTPTDEFYTHRRLGGVVVHNPPVPYFHEYQNEMREQRRELVLDDDLRMLNEKSQIYKDHFKMKAQEAAMWYEQQQRNILESLALCGLGPNWWVRNNRAQQLAALAAAGASSVIARPPRAPRAPPCPAGRERERERSRSPKTRPPPSGTPATRRSSRYAARKTDSL